MSGGCKRALQGIGNGFKSIAQHGRFVLHFCSIQRYSQRCDFDQEVTQEAVLAPSPRPGDMVWIASPSSVTFVVCHGLTGRAERRLTRNVSGRVASSKIGSTPPVHRCGIAIEWGDHKAVA